MDFGELAKLGVQIFLAVCGAVGSLYAYINRGRKEDKAELEAHLKERDTRIDKVELATSEHSKTMAKMSERLAGMDAHVKALPSQRDFAKLQAEVQGVSAKLDGIERSVDRMTDYLMDKDK